MVKAVRMPLLPSVHPILEFRGSPRAAGKSYGEQQGDDLPRKISLAAARIAIPRPLKDERELTVAVAAKLRREDAKGDDLTAEGAGGSGR